MAIPPPPPGPPPGPPPDSVAPSYPAAPGPEGPPSRGLSSGQIAGIAAGVAAVGIVVGLLVAGGGDGDGNGKGGDAKRETTVKLEPVAATSSDPFTPPLSPETLPSTTTTTAAPGATATPGAPAQGPFGGTGDNTLCDREQLISYLTDPAHSAQAREWARVVGISVGDIPTYIRGLIPTTLTRDTAVTNHTFKNGRAVPLQSVLQAGTAVLVDTKGKLVARCRCGNPLLEPQKWTEPVYSGPRWPGFNPTTIIIIQVSQTNIFPPGGSTTTTTLERGGREAEALAIFEAFVQRCYDIQGPGGNRPTYAWQAFATDDRAVYEVYVPDQKIAVYLTNVDTATVSAGNDTAAKFISSCPGAT